MPTRDECLTAFADYIVAVLSDRDEELDAA